MRRKALALSLMVVFVFTFAFSFFAVGQEAEAGPLCACTKYCACAQGDVPAYWDVPTQTCVWRPFLPECLCHCT